MRDHAGDGAEGQVSLVRTSPYSACLFRVQWCLITVHSRLSQENRCPPHSADKAGRYRAQQGIGRKYNALNVRRKTTRGEHCEEPGSPQGEPFVCQLLKLLCGVNNEPDLQDRLPCPFLNISTPLSPPAGHGCFLFTPGLVLQKSPLLIWGRSTNWNSFGTVGVHSGMSCPHVSGCRMSDTDN